MASSETGGPNTAKEATGATETQKKKKPARKPSRNGRSRHYSRILDPHSWTLKWRFVWITALLLLVGNACLVAFFLLTLEHGLNQLVNERLALTERLLRGEVQHVEEMLGAQAASLSRVEALTAALKAGDHEGAKDFLLRHAGNLRRATGLSSLNYELYAAPATMLAQTANVNTWGAEHADDVLLKRILHEQTPLADAVMAGRGLALRAAAAVLDGDQRLGAAVALAGLGEIFARMELPAGVAVSLVARTDATQEHANGKMLEAVGAWTVLGRSGKTDRKALTEALSGDEVPDESGNVRFETVTLSNKTHGVVGMLLLAVDVAELKRDKWQNVVLLSALFLGGSLLILLILYYNVGRVEAFFKRLKKIIIASHANDFTQRFESDTVHCLEVMHCHNEECPVYKDPGLICYLETGSEAISPQWRDTCIYLNKYEKCQNCPVYAMRKGDELAEMRNVVNTMMRLWNDFLTRVGHLLSYVLRAQEQSGRQLSLDEVSSRLEQMAKLTFFGHDLQGVLDKEEVYNQLAWIFQTNFDLSRYMIFEVDPDTERIVLAVDACKDDALCKRDVLLSSEICRAKRTAEDVVSFYNPKLCPYFNCDHSTEVRCCLPVVMGGQVGAVFSFVAPRRFWEDRFRPMVPILRKYLDETGPVLSSLRLLSVTKEQALRDPLTRCHNRRFLDEFITKYEPLSRRDGKRTGFLMADIDYFKEVNDKYGHEAGDAIIQQVVHIMEDSVRRSDLVIRYGGEEFLLLLQDVQQDAALDIAEKIRASVEQHKFQIPDGAAIHKTISIGVAEFPEDAQTLYKCIKFADVALYEAKNTGRNKVIRFQAEMWKEENY